MRGIPATAVAVFLAALAISSTALAVAPTYTLRVRTGIAPVDLVLGRLETNDAGSLVASIVYQRLPCTRKSDPLLPRPRCLPGEPTGKLVKVVPAGTHGCGRLSPPGGYGRDR